MGSSVILKFAGICTHIPKVRLTPPEDAVVGTAETGFYTRVVLPDASLGYRWNDQEIAPHDAVLRIPKKFVASFSVPLPHEELDDTYTWRLRGVQLYVTRAAEDMTTETSYDSLPSLTDISGRLSLELDRRVVLEGRAAAVVDLYGGVRDAYKHAEGGGQAVVGAFSVRTETQQLAVVLMRDPRIRGYIQLQDAPEDQLIVPPRVYVMNTGRDADIAEDFFLHYYVTTWTPPHGQKPPAPENYDGVRDATQEEMRQDRILPIGLTFGCSNSIYP
jgi:hypothetical protein